MSAFIMDEANYQAVLAFWHNVQGRAYSFRFIDTGDCAGLEFDVGHKRRWHDIPASQSLHHDRVAV